MSSSPATVESARSAAPLAICWPAKVSSSATKPMTPITTRIAASERGAPRRWSPWTTGVTRAEISNAMASGRVTIEK